MATAERPEPITVLMSYPRSGNHLVRAYVEAVSGRPTLGCLENPQDVPIRDRFADTPEAPFARHSEVPVARKIHWLREALELRRHGLDIDRLCLIVRDPRRCVISQLVRSAQELKGIRRLKARRRLQRPDYLRQQILVQLAEWQTLVDHYLASERPKLALRFEDLTSDNRLAVVNERLLPFFGISERFASQAELDAVGRYGREGQLATVKALPEAVYAQFQAASAELETLADYPQICRRIGAA